MDRPWLGALAAAAVRGVQLPTMSNSSIRRERVPLIHDNHSHVSLYAALASCPDISGLHPPEAMRLLRSLPADSLSVVRGWRTNELPVGPADLASLPPVLLINFSLHGFALSDAALPYLSETVPDLVEHKDDASWREANVPRLFDAYCGLSGVTPDRVDAFMDGLLPLGVGSTEDMAVANPESLAAMRNSGSAARIRSYATPAAFMAMSAEERSACDGVKLFLDGSIGARTAGVRGPWLGGGAAVLAYRNEDLDGELSRIASWKTGASIHAIGELAIEQALDSLERLRKNGAVFPLVRLEHAQFISEEQGRRARDLGLVLSMQPNFSSDSECYADRLPAAYLENNNPFRMLIDRVGFVPGTDLIFGSDGMPHGLAYPATLSLFPPFPVQRLSLSELLAGYGPARGMDGVVVLEIDDQARQVRVMEES